MVKCPYYRRRQAAGGDGSDHDCCGAEQSPTSCGRRSSHWATSGPSTNGCMRVVRRHVDTVEESRGVGW